jgi:hypothetical protein
MQFLIQNFQMCIVGDVTLAVDICLFPDSVAVWVAHKWILSARVLLMLIRYYTAVCSLGSMMEPKNLAVILL